MPTVKIRILLPKSVQEAPGSTDTAHAQIRVKILEPQKHDNSEAFDHSDAIILPKVAHTRNALSCKIAAPYPKRLQSYHQKGLFLFPFKTLVRIPFKTPNIGSFKTLVICKIQLCLIHIRNFLSRPLLRAILIITFAQSASFDSFQDPRFSLFPGSWQVDSSFFSPQSLTGMQRTSNWHLMSGRVRSP